MLGGFRIEFVVLLGYSYDEGEERSGLVVQVRLYIFCHFHWAIDMMNRYWWG